MRPSAPRFYVLSPNNSSADFDQNSNPLSIINAAGVTYPPIPTATTYANGGNGTFKDIRVDPGAHMPGVPLHNFNAGVLVHVTPALQAGLTLIVHSFSYVRGNENNRHQPGGYRPADRLLLRPLRGRWRDLSAAAVRYATRASVRGQGHCAGRCPS